MPNTGQSAEPSKRRTLPHSAEVISIPPQKRALRREIRTIAISIVLLVSLMYCFGDFDPEIALATLLLTGFFFYQAIKIRQLKYSLIVNAEGIIDHHNFYGLGFVPWEQVENITFEERESSYQGFSTGKYNVINILIRDPEKVLSDQKERWYRFFLRFRFNVLLKKEDVACDHFELYELLLARLQKHRAANSNRQIRASL